MLRLMTTPSDYIATLRAQWAARFIDTVTFVRATGRGTLNASTLLYTGDTETEIYSGVALIRPVKTTDDEDFGQQETTLVELDVFMPYDAGDFQPEDLGTIDTATHDTDLVGKTMRVIEIEYDSYLTRTRVRCRLDIGAGFVDTS
ncbi:hypothetical protein LCGC14_0859530 [marine sediment metagenome]|uniref:Uncharacterized protein n=1 Tax=marine sediment metagenome TaxID=412755 RepID=A0A0F9SEW4_9ZZZZ